MRSPTLGVIPLISKKFEKDFTLELFRRGNYARYFEFKVKEALNKELFRIPVYLSIGTEFNSAALSLVMPGSHIFAQHRCHALYLNFGGKPEALRDELLGLPSGCSGGMSGSNAIQAPEANMYGHSGLMGEQIPIAVGAALASNELTLAICGDASVEEDYIYPSLGWAVSKKLPVLFVCEDNDLSILTKSNVRRDWNPVDMVKALGMPAVDITDDPWLLAHHARKMSNNLPGFINVRTVRHHWHAGTGIDGEPEWNRYEMVIEKLASLGLKDEITQIEVENSKRADLLWAKQLQKL